MSTTLGFKNLIDLPEWRPCAPSPTTSIVGECLAWDHRNNADANPYLWHLAGTTSMEKYNTVNDEWCATATYTAVGVTPAAGSGIIFVPSHGPAGTVGASPAAGYITLAALPNSASVGINQLANRGDGVGYKIRVIGKKATTGSGLIEERTIVANTGGTTPTVYFDTPLTFTPTTSDTYEVLSGRVYILSSGTTAAGYWKAYDVATGTISGNLATTNLAATIALDFQAVALDEAYVPYNRDPGEGFVAGGATYNGGQECILATASGATSITGSGMPAALIADEYKNFQVRIVKDVTTPAAVGQRARITTHTGGATGVFTVASWPVATPSADASFVIENNNDLLLWTNGALVTYSYKAGAWAADANWSTAAAAGGAGQYANAPAAQGAGAIAEQCFGIVPDTAKYARHSHIWWFRGANTVIAYYLDIAGAATGAWSAAQTYGNTLSTTFTTGTASAYDPATNQGRYLYICVNGTQRFLRFDLLNRVLEPWTYLRYAPSTAVVGGKLAMATFIDGSTKLSFLYVIQTTASTLFNIALQR